MRTDRGERTADTRRGDTVGAAGAEPDGTAAVAAEPEVEDLAAAAEATARKSADQKFGTYGLGNGCLIGFTEKKGVEVSFALCNFNCRITHERGDRLPAESL